MPGESSQANGQSEMFNKNELTRSHPRRWFNQVAKGPLKAQPYHLQLRIPTMGLFMLDMP